MSYLWKEKNNGVLKMLNVAVLIICLVLGIEYYILYLHKKRLEEIENELLQVYSDEDKENNS